MVRIGIFPYSNLLARVLLFPVVGSAMPIDLWSRLAMNLWWLRWGIDLVVQSGTTTLAQEIPIARAMQECADHDSDDESGNPVTKLDRRDLD